MRVIVCGAGQVGLGIAEKLAFEQNDVSVIDADPKMIDVVRDTLDVKGIVGNGAHPDTLALAGAKDADMIIAVTQADEVNIVTCQVAHAAFNVPTKVARIRAQSYLAPEWRDLFARDAIPIDVIISPEIEVGDMVLRRLSLPGAVETVRFAEDTIVCVGIACEADCPVVDTPLRQLFELFPDLGAVVVGIVRDGKVHVPHSDDMMLVGDLAYVVCRRDQVRRTLSIFGHEEPEAKRIVIAGGGNIGLYVARQIEERQPATRVKIIEHSRDRALSIADRLSRTVVLNGSALESDVMTEADIAHCDALVAVTNDDEVNIIAGVIAKKLGCRRVLALLNNSTYSPLTRDLGIDTYINPRQVTVSRVLQHVRRGRIRGVHSLQNGAAEVIEAEALETSPLVNRPLRELALPDGMRIGAIYRAGKVHIPDGSFVVLPKDRIVIFAVAARVRKVEQMFRVSLEFF